MFELLKYKAGRRREVARSRVGWISNNHAAPCSVTLRVDPVAALNYGALGLLAGNVHMLLVDVDEHKSK
jgi:hypothetical protein